MRKLLLAVVLTTGWAMAVPDAAMDAKLTDQVRRKLANDVDIKGGALDVDVHDGNAILKGKVAREKDKAKAERLTKKIKGVKAVTNQLEVSPLHP